MNTSRVLTVNDYYDGPRLGVAEYLGAPHIYESEFDHSADEYPETYFLSPIEPALLALVLEDWDIWLRWDAAYERGEVDIDSHPSLPDERTRHEELKTAIGSRLRSSVNNRISVKATFGKLPNTPRWRGLTVVWEPT